MNELACIHCIVSGRVQGVWYRSKTKDKAQNLQLTGWVRNLPSGEVEVMACGSKEALAELCDWLWEGPTLAKVIDVKVTEQEWQEFNSFEVV